MTSKVSYIEKVHLKSFRHFKELDVEFNPNFNFITGPNACGKTSILVGIAHCFSHYELEYSRFGADAELWTEISYENKQFRIGFGNELPLTNEYRKRTIFISGKRTVLDETDIIRGNEAIEQMPSSIPLFLGAHHNIQYKEINGINREPLMGEKIKEYARNSIDSIYSGRGKNIKQWLINRYFIIEKSWAEEERKNWNYMLEKIHEVAPFNSDFSFIEIRQDMEPIFSLYGEQCYLEELSSGYQAVLSIIVNIIEWIEGTRAEGERDITQASGTVIIDELDVHLHPEWQLTLRDGLESIFPNLQFIVTTHSPHLLASAKPNEIIAMPSFIDEVPCVLKPSPKAYSGWNTDQILETVMGVESLENKVHEKLVHAALEEVEKNSVEGLKAAIDNLKKVSHPSDTIIASLNIQLASMMATEDD